VFTGKRGSRLSQSLPTWYWAPVRARAGLGDEVVPHMLRHFAGHHFYVRLGVSDHDTAAQLGHADGGKLIAISSHVVPIAPIDAGRTP